MRAGRDVNAADALLRAGVVASLRGELERAEHLNRRALRVYEATGPHWELACLRNNLGHMALMRGDEATALREIRAALAIHDQIPSNTTGGTRSTRWAGARGEISDARRAIDEGFALARPTRAHRT